MSIIKHKQRWIALIVMLLLSFFVAKGALYARYHLNEIVQFALKKSINYEIKFSNVKIENFNQIEIDNLSVKNSEGDPLFTVSSAQVKINWIDFFFTKQKIESIQLTGANINLSIAKNGQVNFLVGMQSSGGSFSLSDIPIKQFTVINSSMTISDLSKSVPFNMTLTDINGAFNYLSSSNSTLSLSAKSGTQSMSINGSITNKGYNIHLTLGGIQLTPEISQFIIPKEVGMTLLSGTASGSIDVTEKDWIGTLAISNTSVNYEPVTAKITGLNGTLNFNPRGVDLVVAGNAEANGEVHPLKFNLQMYSATEKILVGLYLGGTFDQKDIDCYSILRDLPVKYNAVVENPSVAISLTKGQLDFAKVKIHVDTFNMMGLQVDNGDTELNYDGRKMQLEIPSFTGSLSYQGMPIGGTFNNIVVGQKDATGDFVLNSYNNQYYFNALSGNFKFIFATKTPTCYIYNGKNVITYTMNPKAQTMGLKLAIVDPIDLMYKGYTFNLAGNGNFVGPDLYHFSGTGRVIAQNKYIASPLGLNITGSNGIFKFTTVANSSGMSVDGNLNTQNNKNFTYSISAENIMTPIPLPNSTDTKNLPKIDFYSNYLINGDFNHIDINFNGEVLSNNRYIASAQGDLLVKNFQTMEFSVTNGSLSWNNFTLSGIKADFVKGSSGYTLSVSNANNQINYVAQVSSDFKTFNGSGSIQSLGGSNITLGENTLLAFNIDKLKINSSGTLTNPNIQLLIQSAEFQTNFTQIVTLTGAISYNNQNLSTSITLDGTNTIKGNVNFKEKQVNLVTNFSTTDLSKYYNSTQLKNVTLDSTIGVKGSFDSLSVTGQVKLENLPYVNSISKGIEFIFNYDKISIGDLFKKGTFNISSFELLDSEENSIYSMKGSYNFENRNLTLSSDQNEIDLSQIDLEKHLSGILNVGVNISGPIDALNGTLSIKGNNLNLNHITINTIDIELAADKGKFTINQGKVQYNQNQNVMVNGDFTPLKNQYNLSIVGQEMNLSILQPLFNGQLTNLSGLANVNLAINSKGYTGNVEFINSGFSTMANSLNFNAINGTLEVSNSNVLISKLTGKLNGGDFSLNNYEAKIPNFSKPAQFISNYLSSQYGTFTFSNINYSYQDDISLQLSGTVNLIGNNVKSDVTVLSGQVTGIPQKQEQTTLAENLSNITDSVGNILSGSGKSSVTLSQPIIITPLSGMNVVIAVNIKSPISINIPSYSVAKNITAAVQGNGTITIQNGKINVLGTYFTNTGSAMFMGNSYSIQTVNVTFQNTSQYLPEVNPNITATISTIVNNNAIWIGLTGTVKNMIPTFSSSNAAWTQEDIASLLAFNQTSVNMSAQGAATDMVNKGVSSEVFSPYTNKIGQAIGLDSLSVDANFITTTQGNSSGSSSFGPNPSTSVNSSITNPILGLSMTGTKNLYKDIISSTIKLQYSDVTPGQVSSYTWTLNYNLFTEWTEKLFDTISLMSGFQKFYNLYGNNQTLGYAINPQKLADHNYVNYLMGIQVTKTFFNPFNF